ncbi:MAG: semialdehyde dehydrogenase [Gemmatimonadetes bacterium]|nr:semialdehyde dehydrogenase [Gemmatimonadota bacterium]|tara:strand:- start:877 stop:1710 length:834 start_codon:yes stop_codon:yes gene_type:complete
MTKLALIGAAGHMGTRAWDALGEESDFQVMCVESPKGESVLKDRGIVPVASEEAVPVADVVLLAVPDILAGRVAADLVPQMKSAAMLMCLDPAAPYAGELPERADVTYFVTHPAHPPVFNDEESAEARRDFFGRGLARQSIVNALIQGPEEDYVRGEAIAARMFGPILRSHRVTLEQMAMLEPAMSETVAATCITVMREAMDEAVSRGVPFEAARDFMMGHIFIELAILFDETDWQLSDGAKKAVEEAKKEIFQADWKKVFEPEHLRESVLKIVGKA